jgi:methylenetetrahydrofolate--tRNA-(uracil-5-)-methyltransferase
MRPGNLKMEGMEPIHIIGAGLAGCEAAWQIAKRGGRVVLFEMKPLRYSPAHQSSLFAELVCSNSFKSDSIENAPGVLKEEMRRLDSLIMRVAEETRVPAGESLAVDRKAFSEKITRTLEGMENVEIQRQEVSSIPATGTTILASGPLTSEALSIEIRKMTGHRHLFFYDAISPIVTAESIDYEKAFRASRYGKGGKDYVNCPMSEKEYGLFVEELQRAERAAVHSFERRYLFEGCLPVEEMAERGRETLAFGPLKPVGLTDPRTGKQPYAVVQLRQEDRFEMLYNLVGFQTRLRQDEQKRIFRMIPGLEGAEFVRLGSVHRNTFIDSPRVINEFLQFRGNPCLFFAGQITGVEGYMESTATGLWAGIQAGRIQAGKSPFAPSPMTAIGALVYYLVHSQALPFQPMNINFGLFPPLPEKARGREKRRRIARRALTETERWKREILETT